MANVQISDLAPATLPLDLPNTFFEVQTIEGGINVSRKLAGDDFNVQSGITIEDEGVPLAALASTLDFVGAGVTASGAGGTKTITIPGGGGQVDSVVGGVNITVNAGDPVNPIVDLDAAITGVSVNGVTLTNAGVATNYLDETGAYSIPPGSGNTILVEDEGTPLATAATTLNFVGAGVVASGAGTTKTITIAGGGGGAPGGANTNVQFNNAGAFGGSAGFTWTDLSRELVITHDQPAGSGRPSILITTDVAAPAMEFDTNQTFYSVFEINADVGANVGFDVDASFVGADATHFLRLTDQAGSFLQTWTRDGTVDISNGVLVVDQNAPAAVRIAASSLLEMNERTAQNAPTAGVGQYWVRDDAPNTPMFTDDAGTDFELNAAASVPDPLIIGSINATSALTPTTGGSYINCPINIGANLIGTMPMTVLARQRIQNHTSSFAFGGTLFINIDGGDTWIGSLNGASVNVDYNNEVNLRHGAVGTIICNTVANGLQFPVDGTLFMDERAAAAGNIANHGQFWVRNDVPNVPMFTDDAGTDFVLNASGAAVAGANTQVQYNNSGVFGASADFTWDDAAKKLTIDAGAVSVPTYMFNIDLGSNTLTQGLRFLTTANSPYTFLRTTDQTGANGFSFVNDHTLSAPNHRIEIESDLSGSLVQIEADGVIRLLAFAGSPFEVSSVSGVEKVFVQNSATLMIEEVAAALADQAGYGQLWVRNDAPNNLMFTDDAGTDFVVAGESGPFQYVEQSIDDTVNNSTTLVDSELILTNIPTGHYAINLMIFARDVAVSGCGIRTAIVLAGASSPNTMRGSLKNFTGSGVPVTDLQGQVTDAFLWPSLTTGSGTSTIMLQGYCDIISGTNSVTVRFAQNTAQVGDLDFESGSFLSLTRLGST